MHPLLENIFENSRREEIVLRSKGGLGSLLYDYQNNELSRDSEEISDNRKFREVAQLVAHYVRDVGVGCSSHLFSTKKTVKRLSFLEKGQFNIAIYG